MAELEDHGGPTQPPRARKGKHLGRRRSGSLGQETSFAAEAESLRAAGGRVIRRPGLAASERRALRLAPPFPIGAGRRGREFPVRQTGPLTAAKPALIIRGFPRF
jgi:hypothetical protein